MDDRKLVNYLSFNDVLSFEGEEAWEMKFVIRCSKNPIFMEFNGKVTPRKPPQEMGDIYLCSLLFILC